jgi:hypothetical protein
MKEYPKMSFVPLPSAAHLFVFEQTIHYPNKISMKPVTGKTLYVSQLHLQHALPLPQIP